MIADKTMQDIASSMTADNIKTLITELGSWKQAAKNKDETIVMLRSMLDALTGKVSDNDADPDFKPLVYKDRLIIKSNLGFYSFRTMAGNLIPELEGSFTSARRAREFLDDYLTKNPDKAVKGK